LKSACNTVTGGVFTKNIVASRRKYLPACMAMDYTVAVVEKKSAT